MADRLWCLMTLADRPEFGGRGFGRDDRGPPRGGGYGGGYGDRYPPRGGGYGGPPPRVSDAFLLVGNRTLYSITSHIAGLRPRLR